MFYKVKDGKIGFIIPILSFFMLEYFYNKKFTEKLSIENVDWQPQSSESILLMKSRLPYFEGLAC